MLPALHIYNVAGIFLLAVLHFEPQVEPVLIALTLLAALVAYSFLNSVPSIFFGVADESTAFLVLPSSRYLLLGRGYEASILSGVGGLAGALVLLLVSPFAVEVIPPIRAVVGPHLGWILLSLAAYMVVSEWPIGTERQKGKLARLWNSWDRLLFGILTFLLAGGLGMVILNRTMVPSEMAFQSVMPAFVGLFAIPWLIQNLLSRHPVPPQHVGTSLDLDWECGAKSIGSGSLAGLFAATFPVVTAGVGSLVAGHATAQQDERGFVLGFGVTKLIYYAGAFLFFFAPGLNLSRGGMAWMVGPIYQATTPGEYYLAIGVLLVSASLSFFLLDVASQAAIASVELFDHRNLSWLALVVSVGVVSAMTGGYGLAVMVVATGIGLIPTFFSCRRSHCMAVLLLPVGLAMTGYQEQILDFLGL